MTQLSFDHKQAIAAQNRGGSTRYLFMDVLRVLAFSVIIYYHFFKDLAIRGIADITDPDFVLSMGRVHIVKLAVGMFFMISGVGLAVKYSRMHSRAEVTTKSPCTPAVSTSRQSTPADNASKTGKSDNGRTMFFGIWDAKTLKSYYIGRFKQILIPFYIVYIIYAIIKLKETGGTLFGDTPAWRIVFTLLGLDNYCLLLSFRSFSLSIGEWFLSVLVVMYILFPLIYALLKKYPKPTMIIGIIYFIVISYTADKLRAMLPASIAYRFATIMWHVDPFVKICEFALGVFLGIYLEDIKRYPQLIAVGLLAFTSIHPAIINTALILAIFLIGLQMEKLLTRENAAGGQPASAASSRISRGFTSIISAIAGLSYYIYLVHHAIIYSVDDCLAGRVILSPKWILALFIAELTVMVVTAMVLRKASRMVQKLIVCQ